MDRGSDTSSIKEAAQEGQNDDTKTPGEAVKTEIGHGFFFFFFFLGHEFLRVCGGRRKVAKTRALSPHCDC